MRRAPTPATIAWPSGSRTPSRADAASSRAASVCVRGKQYVGYAILAHVGQATPVEVRLAWGPAEEDGKSIVLDRLGSTYDKRPFRFTAGTTTDSARLSVTLSRPGCLWIGGLSLMPEDHVHGMRPDTLALIKQLRATIMRWPGGNFVSGYDWKDGIGDRDRRPPRWERAWNDVEDNDFGIDEFMVFCREVNIEPLVVVNTGLGSVRLAAEEVEYVNGPSTSRWARNAAKNGHPQPYAVKWWGIGNEMFGDWQLGNVAVEQYMLRHNAFVGTMRQIDPSIRVVAVGAPGKWNDVFLAGSAAHVDLLSGHFYAERQDASSLQCRGLAELRGPLRRLFGLRTQRGAQHRHRHAKADRQGCEDRPHPPVHRRMGNRPRLEACPDACGVGAYEHYYCLGDAIAVARGLHELLRSADLVQVAAWPQTVNVIGAIKTTRNRAVMDPVGHVLSLYGAELRGRLVPLEIPKNAPLDAVAATDEEHGTLTIGLINYSPWQAISLKVKLSDKARASTAACASQGAALGDINIPGKPEAVTVAPLEGAWSPDQLLTLPAHSITMVQLK